MIIAPGVNPGSGLTNLLVQAEHDKSKTSKEALIEIIDKHGVDFDPNICGIERICAAPSELVGSGYRVPRVYTRGYNLGLLRRHKTKD